MIFTIAIQEFKSHFKTPLAWVLFAVLQIILSYLYLTQVETFVWLATFSIPQFHDCFKLFAVNAICVYAGAAECVLEDRAPWSPVELAH